MEKLIKKINSFIENKESPPFLAISQPRKIIGIK